MELDYCTIEEGMMLWNVYLLQNYHDRRSVYCSTNYSWQVPFT